MVKRVFIIHGWVGKPDRHWYPWLKAELEKRGVEVVVPAMPNIAEPKLSLWLDKIQAVVKKSDSETFFVGHSVGVNCILRYIEGLPADETVGGAVFVAGLVTTKKKKLADFIKEKFNYAKIKKKIKNKIVFFHSDNDPIIPLADAQAASDNLDAKLVVIKGAWHFDDADGWTELPQARDALLKMMN